MQEKIQNVLGREILDSRGNPTVEAEVTLSGGAVGRASVPSGASTGIFEAVELRDGEARYHGKGVRRAVSHINGVIDAQLKGMNAADTQAIDAALCALDGTEDKSRLGANGILAVSLAAAKAAAAQQGLPLYQFLGGESAVTLPVPMMNILNGGAHAGNSLDVQEFMIMPVGADCFAAAMQQCCEVYHTLAALLKKDGYSTAVGDEGGFAPELPGEEAAIEYILRAVTAAGYLPGKDFLLAMDAAASEWKTKESGIYHLPKSGKIYTNAELIEHWADLCKTYPICSIEDPLDEEDWQGWQQMTGQLGGTVQLVGDDLFVTNTQRISRGTEQHCGNAVLIKPNQIGTLSETIEAVRMARQAGWGAILSHRSGETEDTTIADLAVALGTGQIKTGAPCRSERTAKYNRLLRIAEQLGKKAIYPGICALKRV